MGWKREAEIGILDAGTAVKPETRMPAWAGLGSWGSRAQCEMCLEPVGRKNEGVGPQIPGEKGYEDPKLQAERSRRPFVTQIALGTANPDRDPAGVYPRLGDGRGCGM